MDLPACGLGHLGQRRTFCASEQLNQHGLLGALTLGARRLDRDANRLQPCGCGHVHLRLCGAWLDELSLVHRGEHLDASPALEVVGEVGQFLLRMLRSRFEQRALGVREFHCLPFDVVDVFFPASIPAA